MMFRLSSWPIQRSPKMPSNALFSWRNVRWFSNKCRKPEVGTLQASPVDYLWGHFTVSFSTSDLHFSHCFSRWLPLSNERKRPTHGNLRQTIKVLMTRIEVCLVELVLLCRQACLPSRRIFGLDVLFGISMLLFFREVGRWRLHLGWTKKGENDEGEIARIGSHQGIAVAGNNFCFPTFSVWYWVAEMSLTITRQILQSFTKQMKWSMSTYGY